MRHIRARVCRVWKEEDPEEITSGQMNMDDYVHWLQEMDPDPNVDPDLVMVQRAAFMLRSGALVIRSWRTEKDCSTIAL